MKQPATGTDAENAYLALRQAIVTGDLPPDRKLKIAELRTQFGFGAAPLREALSRLFGERVVVQHSNRGFYVRKVSAEDVDDLGRVRIQLETEALRDSLRRGDDAWEAQLVAAYHSLRLAEERGTGKDAIELRNRAFHDSLVAATPSRWLLDLREQVYAHHERYRHLSRSLGPSGRNTPAEHAAIFEAAIARDIEETCRLMAQHIKLTTIAAVKAMAQ
ncbi:GntR family transcriptional regulator [Epibacterium ulvae]|uniref:GntR family transcriptional regulator n=1 Tax=Epibacterium ulvae TaxID=1156985 RepID=UPI001BFC9382|nr:GntR family transcriptional regulator [Epibacterium ulvae]MBT8152694.1 GntR family transcriptional regulator [Epibacterium ulvae]